MRIPLISRPQGSLDHLGPDDPRPPLPPLPLFIAEARGDHPVSAPFTAGDPYEFAVPEVLREDPRPPTFRPGDLVTQGKGIIPGAAGQWAAEMTVEMAATMRGYPSRIYRLSDISGLRWERLNGRGGWALNYDTATIEEELPSWAGFGPSGAGVVDVLEAVAALTREQVMALPVPECPPSNVIPVELIVAPEGHPDAKLARRASQVVMGWIEDRSWAVDPGAGGFYYSGCYFVYQLTERHWLAAMGRAMNAASVAILGEALGADVRARVAAEWAELEGGAEP